MNPENNDWLVSLLGSYPKEYILTESLTAVLDEELGDYLPTYSGHSSPLQAHPSRASLNRGKRLFGVTLTVPSENQIVAEDRARELLAPVLARVGLSELVVWDKIRAFSPDEVDYLDGDVDLRSYGHSSMPRFPRGED